LDALTVMTDSAELTWPASEKDDAERTCDGAGSKEARTTTGTNNHNQYATRAPAAALSGFLSRPTSSTAALDAIVAFVSARNRSASIVELLNHALELFDVILAELLLLTEVGNERRYAAVKHSIEKSTAFVRQPLVTS
jgi:hypothetical protein